MTMIILDTLTKMRMKIKMRTRKSNLLQTTNFHLISALFLNFQVLQTMLPRSLLISAQYQQYQQFKLKLLLNRLLSLKRVMSKLVLKWLRKRNWLRNSWIISIGVKPKRFQVMTSRNCLPNTSEDSLESMLILVCSLTWQGPPIVHLYSCQPW